jgi:hypothetical protein
MPRSWRGPALSVDLFVELATLGRPTEAPTSNLTERSTQPVDR